VSYCAAGRAAWEQLERERQAGEQLTEIPWCCRNSAPDRLWFVIKHGLLKHESLAKELLEAWSMVEVPEAVLPQIDETRILLQLHHVRPAALIAWSAVESALIYYAVRLDIPLPDDGRAARSPWQLLSYLDSLGYINEADLKRLSDLRNQRNAVAHFSGQGALASEEDIEYGLNFAERVLSGRYVSADQMVDWYQSRPKVPVTQLGRAREIARSPLIRNFPGAEARDVDEAVERLYPDE
jgi:hypothetical protein